MTRRLSLLAAGVALWLVLGALSGVARANTILYTNFGAALSYNTGVGNPIDNDGLRHFVSQGASFSPASNSTVAAIRIALSVVSFAETQPITVRLRSSAGGAPGAVLESWDVLPGMLGPLGANNAPIVLTSLLHPALSVGLTYWVTAGAKFVPTFDSYAWNLNSTGDSHTTAFSLDQGATWTTQTASQLTPGAFQIEGPDVNPVPEPTTLTLLAGGTLLAWRRRGRRV